jgi:Holliday junction resolvase RusA-like endonuclease
MSSKRIQFRIPLPYHNNALLTTNVAKRIHWVTAKNIKNDYKEEVRRILVPFVPSKPLEKVRITYILYVKDNRKRDLDNTIQFVKKHVSDVMTETGILIDDSYYHVHTNVERYGGKIEAATHYVDVIVEEIDNELVP